MERLPIVKIAPLLAAAILWSGGCFRTAPNPIPVLGYAYEVRLGGGYELHGTQGDTTFLVAEHDTGEVLVPGGDDLINAPTSLYPGVDGVAWTVDGDILLRCRLVERATDKATVSYWVIYATTGVLFRCGSENELRECGIDINSMSFIDPWNVTGVTIIPN